MIYQLGQDKPDIHESVFVAESADVIGKVILKSNPACLVLMQSLEQTLIRLR